MADIVVGVGSAYYGRVNGDLPAHRHNRREDRCACRAWVYNPRFPAPTDPNCPEHGELI